METQYSSPLHDLITPVSAISCWQPASQELRPREAANTSWRGPVWAYAPLGLRRGARANPVGFVVVIALHVRCKNLLILDN